MSLHVLLSGEYGQVFMLVHPGERVKIGPMSLHLVPVSGRHAREIQALAADEAIARWTAIPHPYPRDGALAFVERAQRLRALGRHATFAVCEAHRLLGVATLARLEATPDHAELGYWIGRPYWGRGYATAAGRQLLAHGFGRMRLVLVFARCLSANRASIHVLEKLGFRFVGLEAARSSTWPGEPVGRYELTRAGW
jgi:RimJ/RimL family protein N-acetyltransferase